VVPDSDPQRSETLQDPDTKPDPVLEVMDPAPELDLNRIEIIKKN
jgi:hypothetical protein